MTTELCKKGDLSSLVYVSGCPEAGFWVTVSISECVNVEAYRWECHEFETLGNSQHVSWDEALTLLYEHGKRMVAVLREPDFAVMFIWEGNPRDRGLVMRERTINSMLQDGFRDGQNAKEWVKSIDAALQP